MRFVLGVLVGAIAGAGATYVVLSEREGGDIAALGDVEELRAQATAIATTSGERKGKRRGKKRRKGSRGPSPGASYDGPVELSAADRKMTWRGPSVAMPDRDADFSESGGGRSLSSSEIASGVGGARSALSRCIADARGNAEIAAKITLKFLVDGGRVGPVRVRAPVYLQKRGLLKCVRSAIRGASFVNTGGPTVVTLPFELSY